MTKYWCANFDYGDILVHGLDINAWLMQYQYEHGGFDYQGNRRQKARTTETWRSLTAVAAGDWLLAYLSGNAFFAIGQICLPRKLQTQECQTDSVSRTVKDARHLYFEGLVRYLDADVLYEDFTDEWNSPNDGHSDRPPFYPYAQRIDVIEWENVVPDGIEMSGLASAAPLPQYRKPIFQIDADFFHDVSGELRVASRNTAPNDGYSRTLFRACGPSAASVAT